MIYFLAKIVNGWQDTVFENSWNSKYYNCWGIEAFSVDFYERYGVKPESTNLSDVTNTMMNWLNYTQLTYRENGKIYVVPEWKKKCKI